MNPEIKILVVEDEVILCQSLKMIIETLGVLVIGTFNGAQALEVLRQNDISIVLCDVNLPDISGLEILKTVRSDMRMVNMKFILVTAFADEKDVKEGIASGATAYITKPFSSRYLLKMLQEMICITN